jgi:hypothetical protein
MKINIRTNLMNGINVIIFKTVVLQLVGLSAVFVILTIGCKPEVQTKKAAVHLRINQTWMRSWYGDTTRLSTIAFPLDSVCRDRVKKESLEVTDSLGSDRKTALIIVTINGTAAGAAYPVYAEMTQPAGNGQVFRQQVGQAGFFTGATVTGSIRLRVNDYYIEKEFKGTVPLNNDTMFYENDRGEAAQAPFLRAMSLDGSMLPILGEIATEAQNRLAAETSATLLAFRRKLEVEIVRDSARQFLASGQIKESLRIYSDIIAKGIDSAKQCEDHFMVGYIYDEYLSDSGNANRSYNWILKNTPDCELAEDARFMLTVSGMTQEQVNAYLDRVKDSLKSVRQAIHNVKAK